MNTEGYLGVILCERSHGEALTATREAWKAEISIPHFIAFDLLFEKPF